MILLVQNAEEYNNDLRAMIMAFFSGEKISGMSPEQAGELSPKMHREFTFVLTALYDEKEVRLQIEEKGSVLYTAYASGNYRDKKKFRNRLKLAIYRLLSEYTGKTLPWGCLTGVRPAKIAMAKLNAGKTFNETVKDYQEKYDVSSEKAILATKVAVRERALTEGIDFENSYCLYVGIPFCPSRCLYCSFTSYPISSYKGMVEAYLDALRKELQYIGYTNRERKLVSIYVGGGTPTSLEPEELNLLLTDIRSNFDLSYLREFTVEAGRPDSINAAKLKVLKENEVTRISINPQTMNDKTLKTIGRAHTANDVREAFRLAEGIGFRSVNMDIIAGLPGEDAESMRLTLKEIRRLHPNNLTVHSLAIKRAAELKQQMVTYGSRIHQDMEEMLKQVSETAEELGMKPYYMYRQKNIGGNLENVGYAVPGRECLYNILIMEELTDIISAGAGASSKRVIRNAPDEGGENIRIERCENVKEVVQYIERIDEMIERKQDLFLGV